LGAVAGDDRKGVVISFSLRRGRGLVVRYWHSNDALIRILKGWIILLEQSRSPWAYTASLTHLERNKKPRRPHATAVLLFSLVASGQINLRRIDGWRKIAVVLSQNTVVAA